MTCPPRTALLLLFSAGCVGELSFDPGSAADYGGAFDLATAESVWSELDGHEAWPALPGREGIQTGTSTHGASWTLHVNEVAAADPDALDDGSIVALRSFDAASELEAITVMKRVKNFDPDHLDWFWVKYEPDGRVALDDGGTPLAGAVGGEGVGCIGCHASAPGDDFVFVDDEGTEG